MATVSYNTTNANTKIINNVPGLGNELTCAITVGNNANRVIDVYVTWVASVGNLNMNDNAGIVLATVDGTGGGNLTYTGSSYRGGHVIDSYRFVAPQVGSRTVTIRFDDTDIPGSNLLITAGITINSLYDVDQANPVVQSLATNGATSPITGTISATANNMITDGTCSILSTTITAAGTNQTSRWTQQFGSAGSVSVQGTSTMPISSSGSKTMKWNEGTTTRNWAQFLNEYRAVSAVPVSVGFHTTDTSEVSASAHGKSLVGFHTTDVSSVHIGAVGRTGTVVDLWQGDGGKWVTREERERQQRDRRSVVVTAMIPDIIMALGQMSAHGKACASCRIDVPIEIHASATGYVGPSDEEVAGAIAILLNRTN